ncbi:hypothetical protein INR49_032781, partial [Caranx melampygus]
SDTSVSVELKERTQVSQLQESPSSCYSSPLSHRRSVSPVSPCPTGGPSLPSPPVPQEVRLSCLSRVVLQAIGRCSGDGRGPLPQQRPSSLCRELCFPQDTSVDRPLTFVQDKNISFLLKELNVLRNVNQKEQLLQKEKELQRKEVEEELREELREERAWERPTAMLEEALSAQRDRDQALMSRLLLANEERDEALLRARRFQQAAEVDKLDLLDSDMDVDELLQCICDANSVQEVQQFGSVLVQRLQLARQRRNDITAQEMKVVLEERDSSITKCKRLEQDLIQEREQRATKDELLRCQRERDGALDDMQRLEAELQALRANCSVSSMDVLEAPPLRPRPCWSSFNSCPRRRRAWRQSFSAVGRRSKRPATESTVVDVIGLERLVEVLRKKVGTGS